MLRPREEAVTRTQHHHHPRTRAERRKMIRDFGLPGNTLYICSVLHHTFSSVEGDEPRVSQALRLGKRQPHQHTTEKAADSIGPMKDHLAHQLTVMSPA